MDDFNLGGDARHTRVRMEQGSVFHRTVCQLKTKVVSRMLE